MVKISLEHNIWHERRADVGGCRSWPVLQRICPTQACDKAEQSHCRLRRAQLAHGQFVHRGQEVAHNREALAALDDDERVALMFAYMSHAVASLYGERSERTSRKAPYSGRGRLALAVSTLTDHHKSRWC
jgi:hypothetical protein